MAHFAKLDENNIVVFVGGGNDDLTEEELSLSTGERYLKTSYNTRAGVHILGGEPFRGNYAGIGYTYDEELDAFIPPKPTDDAVLDPDTYSWIVPVEQPE